MDLYILNKEYERIGYIDHAESVLWNKKYDDVGECEIYLPCSVEALDLLKKGNYVYREDDDMFCVIDKLSIETDVENGNHLVVNATDMNNILSGRIVNSAITYSGKVCDFIKQLVVSNIINPPQGQEKRAIDNFVFNDSNFNEFNETIEANAFVGDLLELVKTTCKTYNYGFRVKYLIDTQTLEFRLIKGKNKATIESDVYVEFSPTYSNILSSDYKEDDSDYKNVCYVSYKDTNESIKMLSVYNTSEEPEGENRKEVYVDGSSINREIKLEELRSMFPNAALLDATTYYDNQIAVATIEGDKIILTNHAYLLLVKMLGFTTLADRVKRQEFSGEVDTIDTYEYKEDYDIGDVVKVINEYGLGAEARIVEIMESDDNDNGYQIEPKFEYIN